MLAGREPRGGIDIVREARDAQNDGVRGLLCTKPCTTDNAAFAKRSCQPQNAGQSADAVLLIGRNPGKRAVLGIGFGAAMVAHSKREELPLFVAPPGRNGETEEKLARCFLMRLTGSCFADAMQSSRGNQNPAKRRITEGSGGTRALQCVEKRDGDSGSLGGPPAARIDGASRGAQAGQCGVMDAAVGGQPGTPNIPKAGLTKSELAIGDEALFALAFDEFPPKFQRVFRFVGVGLLHGCGEDIEIVNFTEHVLEALQVIATEGVFLGEQAFDGVAETLESNTQRVPRFRFFGAQSLGMKLLGGFETLEREAFGGET